jgi:hypothetical protein
MHKGMFILYIHGFYLKMLDFKRVAQEFIGGAKISNESDLS